MQEITIEYLINHEFEKTGFEEEKSSAKPRTSGMFSAVELLSLPSSDEEKLEELNIRISDLIHDKFGNYRDFGQVCNLNPETIRKNIRFGSKRKISREMLAKFVIGCDLSLEEANELFELHSSGLNAKTTRLDAVVVHCIEKNLDIDGFFDTCKQIGLNIAYVE